MSTRKGNNAKKGQRHQNASTFKNNMHDTSKVTKQINSLVVGGVCARCREVIEWKKKYKKYKPLTAPKKCIRCEQKTIKHAYHTVCNRCAQEAKVCEKCGQNQDIVAKSEPTPSERASEDSMLQQEIQTMTERQRRTFFRHLEKGTDDTKSDIATSLQDDTHAGTCCAPSLSSDEDEDDDDDGEMLSEPDKTIDKELAS